MNDALMVVRLSADDVKIIEIGKENGGRAARNFFQAPRPGLGEEAGGRDAASIIASYKERFGPAASKALLVLGSDSVDYRKIALPFDARRKVEEAVAFELSADLPAGDYVTDHVEAVSREPGFHAFMAGRADRSRLSEGLQALGRAGLTPLGATSDVSTLAAYFRDEQEALVMETGARFTLFVLYHHGVPVLLRKAPVGLGPAGTGGEDRAEAVTRLSPEIKRTIHSFAARSGVETDRLYVTGDLLLDQGGLEALGADLDIDPALKSGEPGGPGRDAFASLLGAASWRRKGPFLDFMKGESAPGARSGAGTAAFRAAVIGGVLLGSVLLAFLLDLAALDKRNRFLSSEIRRTFTEAFPQTGRVVDELRQARNIVNAAKAAASGSPAEANGLLGALRAASTAVPVETRFVIRSLFWEAGKVEMHGSTDSFNTVNAVQELLSGQPGLGRVVISNAGHGKEGRDVEFKITVHIEE